MYVYVHMHMVGEAIHVFKIATAVGIDLWSPTDLRKLLNKPFKRLAEILQQVETKATLPSYLLCNIIALMGKPQGGPDQLLYAI
eukprot:12413719-Karenia_brevis.AAC.1